MQAETNMNQNNPGAEGSGIWAHGIVNVFEENEGWNNSTGLNLFNQAAAPGTYPSRPGGELDTPFNQRGAAPLVLRGNVTASNRFIGFEMWGLGRVANRDHISSYNDNGQVFIPISQNPGDQYFVNMTVVAKGGQTVGISTNAAYVTKLEIEGGRIVGTNIGIMLAGAMATRLEGVTLQNRVNYDCSALLPTVLEYTDVLNVPLPGFPKAYIVYGRGTVWSGNGSFPIVQHSSWTVQRGSRHIIRNWQRHPGEDYRLFEPQQLASAAAWPSNDAFLNHYNCPEVDLTMGQRLGTASGWRSTVKRCKRPKPCNWRASFMGSREPGRPLSSARHVL